jgi:hypothetical protein
MIIRRLPLAFALVLLAGSLSAVAQGTPWSKITTRKKAEPVDQGAGAYALVDSNGPWMILAASFSGEGAEKQARELVEELRTKYKLPAYVYQKEFDFSKPMQGRGVDRYGGPQSMRYQRSQDILETAVMVGDYASVNDERAKKVLKMLKFAKPAALDVEKRGSSAQTLGALRTIQRAIQPDGTDEKLKGPMRNAFITTNPLLPPDFFTAAKGVDKFVLDMNKGVKWSLLDCPGRYTVRVATFTGAVVLDQKIIEKIEKGSKFQSRLAEAADKAHKLTEALRAKGVQAYEFHDRYQSIVTVGSFNSVGTRMPDGKTNLDPALHAIMEKYGNEKKVVPGQATPQIGKPKTEGNIVFDLQPMPVEVPRRSISADYARASKD